MFIWARTSDAIKDFSGTNGTVSVEDIQNEFAGISVSNESLLSFFVSSPANEGGGYTCFVFNGAGVDSANATLHVYPFIATPPQPQYGAVGGSATFTCVGESFPSPTYQWQRVSSSNIATTLTGEVSTTLNVTLGFNDFANSYQCIVTADGTDNAITSSPASITGNVLLSKSSSLFDIIIYVTQFLIIICIILIILFIIVITVCDTLCDYLDNVKGGYCAFYETNNFLYYFYK